MWTLGRRLKRQIVCMMDLPLMSVRAAGIPVTSLLSSPAILYVLPSSAALLVMAVTFLSVWAAHCAPEASPIHESAPVSPEVVASAAEPPEEVASTTEPPEVVALTFELTLCPVTAKEAGHELTVCYVTATEAIHELSALPWLPAPPLAPFSCSMLQVMFPSRAWPSIPPPVPPPLHHPPGLFGLGVLLGSQEPPLEGRICKVCFWIVSFSCFHVFYFGVEAWSPFVSCFPCPHVLMLLVPLFIVSCSDWLSSSCVLFPIGLFLSCDPPCLL